LKFVPFHEARDFVRKLGLKSDREWISYCKSGKKPDEIPKTPWHIYQSEWKSMGDWLGTGKVAPKNRTFRSFKLAREFIHSLKMKDSNDWKEYCKSEKKPNDIPSNPNKTYAKEWKGIGDWLGTGSVATFNKKFMPFKEAREFVRSLGLKNYHEWKKFSRTDRPDDIPANPRDSYNEFKGYGDWIGTGNIGWKGRKFLTFSEARKFVHGLKLLTQAEWVKYCKSENKPSHIPSFPSRKYKTEWKGMGDWLGTGYVATYKRQYKPFEEAREFVRNLGLQNSEAWISYCKSGNKPEDIPASPQRTYKDRWKSMGDWLGTDYISPKYRGYKSFDKARQFVRKLGLKNGQEWKNYLNSPSKPVDIPNYPEYTYKDSWKGIGDWLGTGYISTKERKYRTFDEARAAVYILRLNNKSEWKLYCKSGKKPADIPSTPWRKYKTEWKGMGDWLGTGYVAPRYRQHKSFEEAREFVRKIGLNSVDEWKEYCKAGKKPVDIPTYPDIVYKSKWIDWFDWLGLPGIRWDVSKIKELLRDLISSRILYDWDEAVLYSFLNRKGLLNVGESNRHKYFFKNLIEASRTEQGRRLIEEYANSNSEEPPDVSMISKTEKKFAEEIESASLSEISNLVGATDPLDYGNIASVEQILEQTDVLESISVDEEAMQFYVNYSVDELWKCAFKNEQETIQKVKSAGKNGNKYHDIVVDIFSSDYEGSTKLKIPSGYSFPHPSTLMPPTLMQHYVAFKLSNLPYFGNFSGTGAGKTLSAILASRVIDSKVTVIVCPNDVVEQWKRNILDTFPNSKVITGKDAFQLQYNDKEYQYGVLNYDKFSQEDSPNLILSLSKQKVDFVILDEVHFTKIRNEEEVSKRRENLDGLMTAVRRKNSNIKVLGLSATPVVNNLREGRSLLELISGKIYDDVAVRPTIPNAVTLYEKLSTISIRELPKYFVDVDTHTIEVSAQTPTDITIRHLKSNPLAIEKFLTDARIPEIVKLIDGQTIIYSEYVEDIIKKLSDAVEQAGYSYALYTGFDRSGKDRFLNKRVQVLIASRPLSVGVDGLQHICNRLIINTLPWTNAQYQQLIGRLVRKGQIRDVVHVYLVKASIGGYQYDELKWKRIQFKRTLADCAVDGRLPEKNLVTPQQAAMEAVKWLETRAW
jgi:hypothetical protein